MTKNAEPLLWFGEDPTSLLKIDRSSDFVMDSAISYYKKQEPKLPYIAGQLFLDNGDNEKSVEEDS